MSGLTPTQVRDLVLEAQRDYGRLSKVPLDFYGALLTAARAAAPSVEPEGHTHRWLDGEFLLNGCQLPHVVPPDGAARVVVDGPRAAPPSPEPTPGLREALHEAFIGCQPTEAGMQRFLDALQRRGLALTSPAPEPTGLDAADRRLLPFVLKFYADQMPAYAAAAGLDKEEYAAVMVDVRHARALAARLREQPDSKDGAS